ncbi:MAG: ATP-binding protein [Candidatus Omnitrophota bacterium]
MSFRLINYIISYALVGTVLTYLACFIYFRDRKNWLFKIFALYNLSIAWWCIFSIPAIIAPNNETGVLWCRIFISGVIFMPTLVLHCAYLLLGYSDNNKCKLILKISYLLSFIFLLLNFTPFLIPAAEKKSTLLSYTVPGPFFHLHVLHFFFIMLYAETLYLTHYLKIRVKEKIESRKYLYYFLSSVIATLGGGANYLPVYRFEIPFLNPYGTYTILLYASVVTYTIIRYRFLNTSVIITRAGIFLGVYAIVLGCPFILATSGKSPLVNLFGPLWWAGPLVLMASLGTLGPFVYISLRKKADAILLREQLRYQDILKLAAVDMTRIRNLQKLLDFIAQIITESVRISHSVIYYFNPESKRFELKAGINLNKNQPTVIDNKNKLAAWLEKNKLPLVYEEIRDRSKNHPEFVELEKQMRLLNADVALPCILENKLLDIIILGKKLSGNIYTSDDLDNFLTLAKETALATENAQLYGKIEEDVKQRTKDLVELQKQLIQAEKLATVGTLAGGVAHEINNPLTAILTNVQMLLRSDELDKESLEMIEEATKRCKTIVQKLMVYAKKPHQETIAPSKINLKDTLNSAIAFLKYQFEQDNIKINIDALRDTYLVEGNQNELEQVITNIILNAKDAIKQIKKSGIIELSLTQTESSVKVEIKDDGVGISKDIINRIFDPFFTTKDVGKGLGLGLSICQSILEKHKGKITVRSEINKGAVFTIILPGLKDIDRANSLKDGGRNG